MSNSTKALLIGIAAILVSIFLQSAFLLYGGILTVLIALICCVKGFIGGILERNGRSYYPSFWFFTIVGYILFVGLSVVATGVMADWDLTFGAIIATVVFSLLISILYTYVYFLPYLIANKHNHSQTRAIYILNIFAGWTILAWIIGLIWANITPKGNTVVYHEMPQSDADELKKFKTLLDQNIITQEEFNAKKAQILGLNHSTQATPATAKPQTSYYTPRPESVPLGMWVCQNCGTQNKGDYGQCKKCGNFRRS